MEANYQAYLDRTDATFSRTENKNYELSQAWNILPNTYQRTRNDLSHKPCRPQLKSQTKETKSLYRLRWHLQQLRYQPHRSLLSVKKPVSWTRNPPIHWESANQMRKSHLRPPPEPPTHTDTMDPALTTFGNLSPKEMNSRKRPPPKKLISLNRFPLLMGHDDVEELNKVDVIDLCKVKPLGKPPKKAVDGSMSSFGLLSGKGVDSTPQKCVKQGALRTCRSSSESSHHDNGASHTSTSSSRTASQKSLSSKDSLSTSTSSSTQARVRLLCTTNTKTPTATSGTSLRLIISIHITTTCFQPRLWTFIKHLPSR